MYEQRDLFSVPVFRLKYLYAEELQNSVLDLFYKIEKEDTSPIPYSMNGYTSYCKDNILDLDECKDLKKFISAAVTRINNDVGIAGTPKLKNSWFSINRKYSYHERHNHLPEVWSGVYYVKSDIEDAPLTFINKNLESHWPFSNSLFNNDYNSSIANFFVETGIMYIFPSYLDHAVDQQTKDNDRVTIAFNFGIKNEN